MNQLINKPLSQSDDVSCIGEQKTNSILYNILTLKHMIFPSFPSTNLSTFCHNNHI